MSKLHELIAVEKDRKQTVQVMIGEATQTFTGRSQHFEGSLKTYEAAVDGGFEYDEEESHLVTSVKEKLDYFNPYAIKILDIIYQKESANCGASADIIIKSDSDEADIVLAEQVPVQALVQYENLLEQINGVYRSIPTNDPKNKWAEDADKGEGYWKSPEVKRRKTKKVIKHSVIIQPTEHHPGQHVTDTVDEVEGFWKETKFSGKFSPSQKSELLGRMGMLISAVKKARARANTQVVENKKISGRLFKFLETGE